MDLTEITAKTVLVRSRIPGVDYVINPYLGCGHGCRYCYAAFMRRYARHHAGAPWGSFVEVKVNLAAVLSHELAGKKSGDGPSCPASAIPINRWNSDTA